MAGKKLFETLRTSFSNLQFLSLDAMHLVFEVDSQTQRQRQRAIVVGLFVRATMRKFTVPNHSLQKHLRKPYLGGSILPLTAQEAAAIRSIREGSMPRAKAKQTLK